MILERRYSSSLIILNSDISNDASSNSRDSNSIYGLKEQETSLLVNENKNTSNAQFFMNNSNNANSHFQSNNLNYDKNLCKLITKTVLFFF